MGGVPRTVDLIVHNANVRTMSESGQAEAVAVSEGRIAAVGASEDMLALRTAGTHLVDAEGGTLLPSVIDSHTHFHRAAVFRAEFIDFDALGQYSIEDVVAAVAAKAAATPAGQWIQGDSVRDYRIAERRWPVRGELDRAAPDHPVVLRGMGKHCVMANSLALRIAGIDRDTEDPPGGRIIRDPSGEPTGVLHETAKLRLDAARSDTVVPAVSEASRLAALRAGIRELQRYGISAIHDIVTSRQEIGDYLLLRERGELGVRVRYYIRAVEAQTSLDQILALGLRSGFGDEWVSIGGIKISVDGSCESRTAALFAPYPGQPENRGLIRVPQPELNDLFERADRNGLQIAVHAIGPRAADMALTAFEHTLGRRPNRMRHRLEHMYVQGPVSHFERARDLGLILSEQPGLIQSSGDAWQQIFGTAGLERMKPLRMALDMGLVVQANSDFPSTPLNPFVGIKGAVTRHSAGGVPIDPSQAVTVHEAMRMMTCVPAYTTFEENVAGTIEPGRRADLRLLDRDPYRSDPENLDTIEVRMTVLGGSVVYADGAFPEIPLTRPGAGRAVAA